MTVHLNDPVRGFDRPCPSGRPSLRRAGWHRRSSHAARLRYVVGAIKETKPMRLGVEMVTPRTGDRTLGRIVKQDSDIDHLCLELVHWGFDPAIDWVLKFRKLVDNNPSLVPPAVSIHGFPNEVDSRMTAMMEKLGATWHPRTEKKSFGKDCVTIVHEHFAVRRRTKDLVEFPPVTVLRERLGDPSTVDDAEGLLSDRSANYDPDLLDYHNDALAHYQAKSDISAEQFRKVLDETMRYVNR